MIRCPKRYFVEALLAPVSVYFGYRFFGDMGTIGVMYAWGIMLLPLPRSSR